MKKTLTTSLLALALTAAPAVMAAPPPPGVGANRAPPRMVQTAPAQVRQMPARPLSRAQYEAERRQLVRQIEKQQRDLAKAERNIAKAERKRDRRDLLQAQRTERRIRLALADLRQDLRQLDRNNPRYARFHVASPARRG